MNAEDASLYRSVTMRLDNLSLDHPDLSFAAALWRPTTKDLEELKRVGRYLRVRPVGAIMFEPQIVPGV